MLWVLRIRARRAPRPIALWVSINVLLPLIIAALGTTAASWLNPLAALQFNQQPASPNWLNWLALGVQTALVWAFVRRLFATQVRGFARQAA